VKKNKKTEPDWFEPLNFDLVAKRLVNSNRSLDKVLNSVGVTNYPNLEQYYKEEIFKMVFKCELCNKWNYLELLSNVPHVKLCIRCSK